MPAEPSAYADLLGPLLAAQPAAAASGARRPVSDLEAKQEVRFGDVSADFTAEPGDEPSNRALVENVRAPGRENPTPKSRYDLVVLGAGVGGLISCIVGRQLGLSIAMVERHYTGGDCLNTGCVPSKALLAAAKRLTLVRRSKDLGIILPDGEVRVDFAAVMARVRAVRADISTHDSIRRYTEDVGVDVFTGEATFSGPHSVTLDGGKLELSFRKCVIATGAAARVIPPLKGVEHLTNGNFWNLEELPARLTVIGAGPIGLELAQAMQRLGSQVTVIDAIPRIMGKEDEAAAALVRASMERDGVHFVMSARLLQVARGDGGMYRAPFGLYECTVESPEGGRQVLTSEALMSSTGRVPNTKTLEVKRAGVSLADDGGIATDSTLRTANPDVFAAGDCLPGPERFTHMAEWQARVAVRNAFLDEGLDARRLLVPRATYTDPEVAAVGRTGADLREAGADFETFTRQVADVDRNKCDAETEGFASLHVGRGGEILGACVCGHNAGDQISEVTLCMQHGLTAAQLAGTMHPYPTAAEVVRQAAQASVRAGIFRASAQAVLHELGQSSPNVNWRVGGGGFAVLEMDRPKALNAVNVSMAQEIGHRLIYESAGAVLLRGGSGEAFKHFSSGGDVKSVHAALQADPDAALPRLQLFHEYRAIEAVYRRAGEVPVVALMDGVCMGCGLGLASGARYRVATERSRLAMPECAIGIPPDAAFSFVATELPEGLGRAMAATGKQLTGAQAYGVGLATHFVPSSKLVELEQALLAADVRGGAAAADAAVQAVLGRFDTSKELPEAEVALGRSELLHVYAGAGGRRGAPEGPPRGGGEGEAAALRRRLEAVAANDDCSPEERASAEEGLKGLKKGSPFAQEVSLRLLSAAEGDQAGSRHARLVRALERDLAATWRLMKREDFMEGVRAVLVDKDQKPKWAPLPGGGDGGDATAEADAAISLAGAPRFELVEGVVAAA